MPEVFVNPLPGVQIQKYLSFDFPTLPLTNGRNLYEGQDFMGNITLEDPAIVELYSLLGTPGRQQGHPKIREVDPEAEDPNDPERFRDHDQVLDYDRRIRINHTGRLSGSFVKYIADCGYCSKIKLIATDVTDNNVPSKTLAEQVNDLTPMPQGLNQWFWLDANTRQELVFNLDVQIAAQDYFEREHVYKLVVKWEFWSKDGRERLPISGFDEAISFEIITKTADF